uniref:mRNA-capping enzyme n=1 Tax=Panagrellus redivivus TaxID=6233 RepID=A0A7E4ZVT1_PANRE
MSNEEPKKTFKRPKVRRRNADGTLSDEIATTSAPHVNGNGVEPERRRKVPVGSALNGHVGNGIDNTELNGITRDLAMKLGLPKRWTYCPKYGGVLCNTFLPMKAPLSEGYDDLLEPRYRFHPEEVFTAPLEGAPEGAKVKLWINLANTERFYGKGMVAAHDCKYMWMRLRGHDERPSAEDAENFVRVVSAFKRENPNDIVAVHCTHGFNRTGFLLASYLVLTENWDVATAITEFAQVRPFGIYKEDYLETLFERYDSFFKPGDPLPVDAPGRPSWEEGPDPTVNYEALMKPLPNSNFAERSSTPLFMDGQCPGCVYVEDEEVRTYVQNKVRAFISPFAKKALKNEFPGSQPVSMDKQNISLLSSHPYMVSWKADGMRYLVLINGENEIYAFDRDNNPFFLPLRFPRPKLLNQHIEDTLVDCEVIMQTLPDGTQRPRMLIYDIITYEKIEYGRKDFKKRMGAIGEFLIDSRAEADAKGIFQKRSEPMSVARKDFWEICYTYKLFTDDFTRNMGHHVDGLIYQPVSEPYTPGRFNLLMKWKPVEEASVDFKLKIVRRQLDGAPVEYVGELHVLGLQTGPFGIMKATKNLLQYDNKIIECNFVNNEWRFMRERTDKSHPNAFATAKSVVNTIRNPLPKDYLCQYIAHYGYRDGHPIRAPPPPPPEREQVSAGSTQMFSRKF